MKLDTQLVKETATLLCQKQATHPDFMVALSQELAERGYILECHQRGIQGTYLILTTFEEAK